MSEGPPALMRAALLFASRVEAQMTRLTALTLALLLAGCGDDRPPAPTPEQAAQLNEAEAMLNNVAQTQEGPANRSASPSNNSD